MEESCFVLFRHKIREFVKKYLVNLPLNFGSGCFAVDGNLPSETILL